MFATVFPLQVPEPHGRWAMAERRPRGTPAANQLGCTLPGHMLRVSRCLSPGLQTGPLACLGRLRTSQTDQIGVFLGWVREMVPSGGSRDGRKSKGSSGSWLRVRGGGMQRITVCYECVLEVCRCVFVALSCVKNAFGTVCVLCVLSGVGVSMLWVEML